jgi:hypothetical protein
MLTYMYFDTIDLERAIVFYNATLGALGMRRVVTNDPAWDRVRDPDGNKLAALCRGFTARP